MNRRNVVLIFFFALVSTATGQTYVSGTLLTRTWTKTNSPYIVTGPIKIQTDEVLTIEPGVDVLFAADVPFNVEGYIHAVGTAADSIRFLPDTASGIREWGGLRILDTMRSFASYDTVRLSYARISHAHGDRGGGFSIIATGALRLPPVVMENCVISHNRATHNGGVSISMPLWAHIYYCTIIDNYASEFNGGIGYGYGTSQEVWHCLIARNRAGKGAGGMGTNESVIKNCTVVENDPGGVGGGSSLKNMIIWRNGNGAQVTDGSPDITYSCVQGGYPGEGNISADPMFADTLTYRLATGSPAIDAGDPNSPLDPDGSRADMGAIPYAKPVAIAEHTPLVAELLPAAPNPFNPSTVIRYRIVTGASVKLTVYDLLGRPVRTLATGYATAGSHEVVWNGLDTAGRPCGSGVYLVRLAAGEFAQVRRMTLLR